MNAIIIKLNNYLQSIYLINFNKFSKISSVKFRAKFAQLSLNFSKIYAKMYLILINKK